MKQGWSDEKRERVAKKKSQIEIKMVLSEVAEIHQYHWFVLCQYSINSEHEKCNYLVCVTGLSSHELWLHNFYVSEEKIAISCSFMLESDVWSINTKV